MARSEHGVERRWGGVLVVGAMFVGLMVGGCGAPGSGGRWCGGAVGVIEGSAAMFNDPERFAGAERGSVIFVHPDGASSATWTAARAFLVGPDGELAWDRLPHVAVYRGHMLDSLTATSNGGATTHAFGVKVNSDAFGTTGGASPRRIVDGSGESLSVAAQAVRRGVRVGLVQSGVAAEPGTAVFLSENESRRNREAIAAALIESGADVLFSGGERHFLPEGADGEHGPGVRADGRDLVSEALARGYTVVYTREQLLALPTRTDRVLGLFASGHTFNDEAEETLRERGLPLYAEGAPTIGEMTDVALRILGSDADERFYLVVEEEATDNFGNKNNAAGMLEAARRADEAFARALEVVERRGDTLLITAADSDAGGMRMVGFPVGSGRRTPDVLPATDVNGAPMDGVGGRETAPFMSAPDRFGRRLPFAVVWAAQDDVSGGILVRAAGLNAGMVSGSMDNTEVAELMRRTLFGDTASGGARFRSGD